MERRRRLEAHDGPGGSRLRRSHPDLVGDPLSDDTGRGEAGGGRFAEIAMVAIVTAVVQVPMFNRAIVSLDEGQLTAIGQRLASGEVLYRDIYTGIFPGIYWLAEALFRMLGSDVLVLRWTQLLVNALTAALLFALARPLVPGRLAWTLPTGYWA